MKILKGKSTSHFFLSSSNFFNLLADSSAASLSRFLAGVLYVTF